MDLFPSAAEDEGISSLEPDHGLSRASPLHQQFVDLRLCNRVVVWGFADVDDFHLGWQPVEQARGGAGDRQVDKHDIVLVSGNGGTLDTHATLVLGAQPN